LPCQPGTFRAVSTALSAQTPPWRRPRKSRSPSRPTSKKPAASRPFSRAFYASKNVLGHERKPPFCLSEVAFIFREASPFDI
jgi:hypothetical protein